jgi:hypothetical protein
MKILKFLACAAILLPLPAIAGAKGDPQDAVLARTIINESSRLKLDMVGPWVVPRTELSALWALGLECMERTSTSCARARYVELNLDTASSQEIQVITGEFDSAKTSEIEAAASKDVPNEYDDAHYVFFAITNFIYDDMQGRFDAGELATGTLDIVITPIRLPIFGVKRLVRQIRNHRELDRVKNSAMGGAVVADRGFVSRYATAIQRVTAQH